MNKTKLVGVIRGSNHTKNLFEYFKNRTNPRVQGFTSATFSSKNVGFRLTVIAKKDD